MIQDRLPPDVALVIGGDGPDVGAIYTMIREYAEPAAGEQGPTIGECTFGEWNGFVYAVDAGDRGAFFINLQAAIAESAWNTCLHSVIEKNPGWQLEAGVSDELGIVEYRVFNAEKSHLRQAAVLNKNIFVLPVDADDRRLFGKWLSGPGVDSASELATLVHKVQRTNTVWVVVPVPKRREGLLGLRVGSLDTRAVYGWIGINEGYIEIEVHAILASPMEASQAAARGRTELALWQASRAPTTDSGMLRRLATHGNVWVSADHNEFVLHGSIAETSLKVP